MSVSHCCGREHGAARLRSAGALGALVVGAGAVGAGVVVRGGGVVVVVRGGERVRGGGAQAVAVRFVLDGHGGGQLQHAAQRVPHARLHRCVRRGAVPHCQVVLL